MQRVTFTSSRGETVELYESPLFLNKIEGLGDVEADIQTQKAPGQDGSTPTNILLAERPIPIEVVILEDIMEYKQLLSRVFNPKLGPGLLVYENDIARREIMAISEHVPKFYDERPWFIYKASIDLICHDPYWTTKEKSTQLVVWEGGLEFPLQLPTEFATQSLSKAKILLNDGDVDAPPTIIFNGPATAPITVENVTTGKFITVKENLLDGEQLLISTAFGNKKVTKIFADGSTKSIFNLIDIRSSFFNLIPGNNLIDYSTGGEYERAGVTISWKDKYLGI